MNAQAKQLSRKTLKVDSNIHEQLQTQAKKNGMTMSNYLVVLLDMVKNDKNFNSDSSTNVMSIKYESSTDLARKVADYIYENNLDAKEFLRVLNARYKMLKANGDR